MKTMFAVYRNGVFRPTESVDLQEGSHVALEARALEPGKCLSARQKRIYGS
jgi:predicted DNA-binding antitoxin AbrB/MazE fold protein